MHGPRPRRFQPAKDHPVPRPPDALPRRFCQSADHTAAPSTARSASPRCFATPDPSAEDAHDARRTNAPGSPRVSLNTSMSPGRRNFGQISDTTRIVLARCHPMTTNSREAERGTVQDATRSTFLGQLEIEIRQAHSALRPTATKATGRPPEGSPGWAHPRHVVFRGRQSAKVRLTQKPGATWLVRRLQSLIQILDQIVGILDPHRNPHHIIARPRPPRAALASIAGAWSRPSGSPATAHRPDLRHELKISSESTNFTQAL